MFVEVNWSRVVNMSDTLTTSITRERFDSGITVEQYQARMEQNQAKFAANMARAAAREKDIAFFAALPAPINTLVITEDWCGDALANAPVLAKIADETGKLYLRLFLRDQNLDLADQYRKQGMYRSVPVFVFFDQNMRELGHFIERPDRATAEMNAVAAQLAAEHPELPDVGGPFEKLSEQGRRLRVAALGKLREERGDAWTDMLLDDVETILARGSARQ
jgi:hypothetical protein